ncbi:uncharacterized protein N7529_006893 [Penicillium soppii]|uniref:uncharacterized protein n=1 Tax=Penicillium soppii TaxID=69789 RepID=UPI00254939B1|nr:uncharacterized protein N7529_006893 [Penicillium soppii]KAJ5864977.1 hypothetical protein N7529_006893 [Penicillium soppii]
MGKTYFLAPDFWLYPAAHGDNPAAIHLDQLVYSSVNEPGFTTSTIPPLSMDAYDIIPEVNMYSSLGQHDNAMASLFGKLFSKAVSLVGGEWKVEV